jgi:hypothetical protein
MTCLKIAIIAVCQLVFVGATVLTSKAATNFNGSTIIGVDQAERTITFKTRTGDKWTLPVIDPDLLKKDHVLPGDQVSIEIDLSDRIIKILKPSDEPQAAPKDSREETSQ